MANELAELFKNCLQGKGAPCLVSWDHHGESLLSAAALWNRSLEKRHSLRKIGLKPGDIWLDQSQGSEQLVNLLACIHGDFVFCPRQLPMVTDGGTKLKVGQHDQSGKLMVTSVTIPTVLADRSEFGIILQTSGTSTGIPRFIKLTSPMIKHQMLSHAAVMPLEADSNRLIMLPGHHSFGLILDRLLGLYAGQNLVFYSEAFFHPRRLLELMEYFAIEWMAQVPRTLQLLRLHLQKRSQSDFFLQKLNIHSGGAFLHPEQRHWWQSRIKGFWWGYGLTECGPGVLMNGKPIGCQVRLVARPHGAEPKLAEIWVQSPSMGLWEGRLLQDDYFATGDMALLKTDHHLESSIEVIGRAEDCFKNSNGQWTHLRNVEQVLQNDFKFEAVRLKLAEDGTWFELRLLAQRCLSSELSDTLAAVKTRLKNLLPVPCRILIGDFTPDIISKLGALPKKSIGDALAHLAPEFFKKSG